MYFNWICTAPFVALNKRGVKKTSFNSINGNTKLMQHRFIKSLVLQLDRIGHSEKKTKVVSMSISSKSLVLKTTNVVVIMTFTSQKHYCFRCVGMLNRKGFRV